MTILPVLLCALLSGEQAVNVELDDFRYADAAAAQAVWKSDGDTPPVEIVKDADRSVMRLAVPFASRPKLRYAVIERRAMFDLTSPGEFLLEAAVDDPQVVSGLKLRFHSGDGWYVASRAIDEKDWQTLSFSKASFYRRGNPAGWNKIDKIQICSWWREGKDFGDTAIRLRRLAAVRRDVTVVIPASMERRDVDAVDFGGAFYLNKNLCAVLNELGLGANAIEERAVVADGALDGRQVAVLSADFSPSNRSAAAIERFIRSGGKIVACSPLHLRLREVLELDEKTAEPAIDRGIAVVNAKVDRRNVRCQLVAALGRLVPTLWPTMAQAELNCVGKVGPYKSFAEAVGNIKPHTPAVANHLTEARQYHETAVERLSKKDYRAAATAAQAARDALTQAYLRAAESIPCEGRAIWCSPSTGPYPGDWDRSAKLLADNGFNMVLPLMFSAGMANYASDVLPPGDDFRRYGDQLAQCCAAAEKYGLEVHPWQTCYYLYGAPKDFIEKMRREGRLAVNAAGEPAEWLCPSHPDNQKLELDSLLEVARKYPVAGLHLDYIRHLGGDHCYCDGCRRRFEAESGRKVLDKDWPQECHSGARKEEYNDWRCRQITALVEAISREGRKIRPDLKISAAVFGCYPACRESKAQDWPAWVRAGYLDFVCPMNYTADDDEFASLARDDAELVEGCRCKLYLGIGGMLLHDTPDRIVGQILQGRSHGADGFTIFHLGASNGTSLVVPGVGLGIGSHPTVPPHRRSSGLSSPSDR